MATIAPFIDRHGETVQWQRRILGARDAVTNWPAVSWLSEGDFDDDDFDCDDFFCDGDVTAFEIKGMFKRLGIREIDEASGRVTEKRVQMDTYSPVQHLDRIVYNDQIYEVESAPVDHDLRGVFRYRTCILMLVGE